MLAELAAGPGPAVAEEMSRLQEQAAPLAALIPAKHRRGLPVGPTGNVTAVYATTADESTRFPGMRNIREFDNRLYGLLYFSLLREVLSDPAVTVLIAPDTAEARYVYLALQLARVDVPRRKGLMAFDSTHLLSPMPITTVDHDFSRLGYCAFHWIVNDLPIRRDRRGEIRAATHVVDRGSVTRRAVGH
jgi:hypothetical protein